MRAEEAMRAILRALEEGAYSPTLKGALKAARDELPPEAFAPDELEALARRALEEAARRAMGVLEGLWRALRLPAPLPGAEEAVRQGGRVEALHERGRGEAEVVLRVREERQAFRFPLPPSLWPHDLKATVQAGRAEVQAAYDLFAREGQAFLHAVRPGAPEEALETTRAFRPLFAALDLPYLPEALLALSRLRNGEARVERGFLLARAGNLRVLRRGLLLGDLALDASLFTEKPVVLSYTRGLSLSLRLSFWRRLAALEEGFLRWNGEVFALQKVRPHEGDALSDGFLAVLLRRSLRYGLAGLAPGLSPGWAALLEELGRSRDPLAVPKEEEFWRRVGLRALFRL